MNPEISLITPKKSFPSNYKRSREVFDSKIFPQIEKTNNLLQEKIEMVKMKETQELIKKTKKIEERQNKTKNVCERINNLLEKDEKNVSFERINDQPSAKNNDYNWYDSDLIYTNSIAFPPELFQKCRNSPGSIIQKGFIAELGFTYLSIGRSLYFWNNFYTLLGKDQSQVFEIPFDFENEIVQIAFSPYESFMSLKNLLIIAFKNRLIKFFTITHKDYTIKLEETDLQIKTTNEVVALTCSKTGRIFYGTDNGEVKEIFYKDRVYFGITISKGGLANRKNKENFGDQLWSVIPVFLFKWRSNPKFIKKLAIDDTRNILYALIEAGDRWEKSEVVIFNLGNNNDKFEKTFTINKNILKKKLSDSNNDFVISSKTDFKIVDITPLDESFSSSLYGQLTTNYGHRIFFSFANMNFGDGDHENSNSNLKELSFQIRFIKSPISFQMKSSQPKAFSSMKQTSFFERRTKLSSTQNPLKIMHVYVDRSVTFLVDEKIPTHNEKTIYFYSRNLISGDTAECSGQINIENNDFLDIQIVRIPEEILESAGAKLRGVKVMGRTVEKDYFFNRKSGSLLPLFLGDFARQVYFPPAHYVFLTSKSSDLVIKLRPIDILFNCLRKSLSLGEKANLKDFVSFYGILETCSMLLQIACSSNNFYYLVELKEQINQEEEEEIDAEAIIKNKVTIINETSDIASMATEEFLKYGAHVSSDRVIDRSRETMEVLARAVMEEIQIFSAKTESISLYLSRVVRPIWNRKLINKSVFEGNLYERLENFEEDELKLIRKKLDEIRNFLEYSGETTFSKEKLEIKVNESTINERLQGEGFESKSENKYQEPNKMIGSQNVFEEKKYLTNLYLFLEKTLQALDILIFLLANRNFRFFLLQMSSEQRNVTLNLKFQDILIDSDNELPLKEILSGFLKRNMRDFQNLSEYFINNFNIFFTGEDAAIAQAECLLEYGLKDKDKKNDLLRAQQIFMKNIKFFRCEKLISVCNSMINNNMILESVRILTLKLKSMKEEPQKRDENIKVDEEKIRDNLFQLFLQILANADHLSQTSFLSSLSNISFTSNDIIFKNIQSPQMEKIFEESFAEIISTEDDILIEKTVEILFYSKRSDQLLKIDSKIVEEALKHKSEEHFHEKYLLLYKFYLKNNEFEKAFIAATRLALKNQAEKKDFNNLGGIEEFLIPENQVILLKQRMIFLNFAGQAIDKAIAEADEAKNTSDRSLFMERKRDLSERMKNAELQNKILENLEKIHQEISRIINHTKKNNLAIDTGLALNEKKVYLSISLLNRNIFEFEYLESEFIREYSLWDCRLLLLDYVENAPKDQKEIMGNYKNLFKNIFQHTTETKNWRECVSHQLKILYQSFHNKSRLFPLPPLISLIETLNQAHPQYKDFLSNGIKRRWELFDPSNSPLWLFEFLILGLDLKVFEVFEGYEEMMWKCEGFLEEKEEDRDIEKEEVMTDDSTDQGGSLESRTNIFQMFYIINLMLDIIDQTLSFLEKDRITVLSEGVENTKMIISKTNLQMYVAKNESINRIFRFIHECVVKIKNKLVFEGSLIELIEKSLYLIKESHDNFTKSILEITGHVKPVLPRPNLFDERKEFKSLIKDRKSFQPKINESEKVISPISFKEEPFVSIMKKTERPI